MRVNLVSVICSCVLAVYSLNANAQVVVDAVNPANDFMGATYNVPGQSNISINSVSLAGGGAINGFEFTPGFKIAKFTGGSFDMSGGTVTANAGFFLNNYTDITISAGTFAPGSISFTNMQNGGSLDISGGVFNGGMSIAQWAGDISISGGEFFNSFSAANPGVDSTLLLTGSNWTFNGNPLVFSGNEADLTEIGFGTLLGTLADGSAFRVVLGGTGYATYPNSPVVTVIDLTIPTVNVFACEGFTQPFESALNISKKTKKAIPAKIFLEDADTYLITDAHIVAPPVITVEFEGSIFGDGEVDDFVLEPVGNSNDGNAFSYNPDTQQWEYRISTKQFSTPGTYTVEVRSGDETEYTISATGGNCTNTFTRLN